MGSTQVPPGMSYYGMLALIRAVRYPQLPATFTNELFVSLFWEETFFNNMRQTGAGTAVGFGQVEPSEFLKFHGGNPEDDEKLDQANRVFRQDKRTKAKSFGYFVDYGLLPTTTYYVPALDK